MVTTHIKEIIKRDGSVVPFKRDRIVNAIYRAAVAVGGRDVDLAGLVADEVILSLNRITKPEEKPSVEEIQDIIEQILIERGHARTSKAFILYRAEQQGLRGAKKGVKKVVIEDTVPYKKIWYTLVWNLDHQCETIEKLNKIVRDPEKYIQLMNDANSAYEADIKSAAQQIIEIRDDIRLVIIAGPSSSGKTTSTIKLEESLNAAGLNLVAINVDNYFFNLDKHPKDEFGDFDFETPQAIDIKLFNQNLNDLIQGKETETPLYDFKTGLRLEETNTMQIGKNDIILMDCLHGLFPAITAGVPEKNKFKLYLETLAQQRDQLSSFVRWTDIRLLRRMIRDMQFRHYQPEQTLTHWHYVRRSEMRNIIPYIHTVDHIANGALAYELPILKHFLFNYFSEFVEKYEKDPLRRDAGIRARRVYDLLASVEEWTDIESISKTALIREYIGGSSYTY